jgi:tetratricopeptide (TPR) repeat protein/DNA-binding CsgD family transcriptional regulator
LGRSLYYEKKYKLSIEKFNLILNTDGTDDLNPKIWTYLGIIYCELLDLDIALTYLLKANKYYESERSNDSKINQPAVMMNIAKIYSSIENYPKAIDIALTAIKLREEFSNGKWNNKLFGNFDVYYNNIGVYYQKSKKYDQAQQFLLRGLYLSKKNNSNFIIYLYNSLIDLNIELKKYDQAKKYINLALNHPYLENTVDVYFDIYFNYAKVLFKNAEFNDALKFLNIGFNKICHLEMLEFEVYYYDLASRIQQGLNEPAMAIQLLTKFVKLNQIYLTKKLNKNITDLLIAEELEQKQTEKLILKEKIKRSNEELNRLTILFKNNTEQLSQVLDISDGQLGESIDSKILDSVFNQNNSWDRFNYECDILLPEFISTLKSRNPGLTRQEIKICTLIRLGFSTKKISQILFLSHRTISNHRYRLRKKLKISENVDLFDYLEFHYNI